MVSWPTPRARRSASVTLPAEKDDSSAVSKGVDHGVCMVPGARDEAEGKPRHENDQAMDRSGAGGWVAVTEV